MPLNLNEIRNRALDFSKEWQNTSREEADAKPFLIAFFNVFGISNKRVSTFEHKVKKLDDTDGYIDLLWKGVILIEMKSRGKNLDKAYQQALEYTYGLKEHELPKLILVCDFENFVLHDLEENICTSFTLNNLSENIQLFDIFSGSRKKIYKEEDPANVKAAELMGKLHDRLKEIGYNGHPLEVYLVRVLFCLFADDTGIFQKQQFQNYIEQRTSEDGSDLASKLHELFQILNTPYEQRFKNIDEQLADFPYVNGKLFEEYLPTASFDAKMRQALLNCCYIDWSKISPAIFGSMFQSVMNPKERRNLGAHYTSETNILKLIKPLFLDDLWREFELLKENKNKLQDFHKKISKFKFLDPACGCGNFLIITYRELRSLEIEILRKLHKGGQQVIDINEIVWLDVDMMYGIEIEEFPARIAEVAMWLVDHQLNMQISREFGQYFTRLPLKKAANILIDDALKIDWQSLLNPINSIDITAKHVNIFLAGEEAAEYDKLNVKADTYQVHRNLKQSYDSLVRFDFILGNPPFIGSKMMSAFQRNSIVREFDNLKGCGVLDYVTGWYIKAAKYIQGTKTRAAFVSTNSIVQGEQTGILWGLMFKEYGIKIHFAHRTFKWRNEAKGNAAVYCVIIGFANYDIPSKIIFDYEDIKGEPKEIKAKNINPYLVDAKDILITKRRKPLCKVPEITFGSMPNDGGHLLIDDLDYNNYILAEIRANRYIKPFLGAQEFLNGKRKWCLWFADSYNPKDLNEMPLTCQRIKAVEKLRKSSSRESTRKLAYFPFLFGEIRQPESNFILVPRVSSENRSIIPMSIYSPDYIVGDTCLAIANASLFHLGVLQSKMHMTWVNYVCGRLKSDYRYSNEIVYNNFPWPDKVTSAQCETIESIVQKILEIRARFSDCSMSDLYNPIAMPPELVKTHQALDKAVDMAYRSQPFTHDDERISFLFELYEKYSGIK